MLVVTCPECGKIHLSINTIVCPVCGFNVSAFYRATFDEELRDPKWLEAHDDPSVKEMKTEQPKEEMDLAS